MPNFIDLTGKRFGRLLVLRISPRKGLKVKWFCGCECGRTKDVFSCNLQLGYTQSCGCLQKERTSARKNAHHMSYTKEYRAWIGAKNRCYNFKDKSYHHWGGRGITVCERWRNSFRNFFADMGKAPANTSLDRIDVNGNYTPENCRWATQKIQQ